jgi:ArsR family transcriptional regulator
MIRPLDTSFELRPVEGADADEEVAALARALTHPTRVQILRYLARRATAVTGEISRELSVDPADGKRQLQELKALGFIDGVVDGPGICYWLDTRRLRRLRALVAAL